MLRGLIHYDSVPWPQTWLDRMRQDEAKAAAEDRRQAKQDYHKSTPSGADTARQRMIRRQHHGPERSTSAAEGRKRMIQRMARNGR